MLGFGIGFGQWMLVGAPLSLVAVTICWAYLVYLVAPVQGVSLAEGNKVVDARLRERGPLSRDGLLVSVVFLLTVVAWVSRSLVWRDTLPNVNNTAIALMGALTLFLLPSVGGGRLLDWETAVQLPWSVLILMGGGLVAGRCRTSVPRRSRRRAA